MYLRLWELTQCCICHAFGLIGADRAVLPSLVWIGGVAPCSEGRSPHISAIVVVSQPTVRVLLRCPVVLMGYLEGPLLTGTSRNRVRYLPSVGGPWWVLLALWRSCGGSLQNEEDKNDIQAFYFSKFSSCSCTINELCYSPAIWTCLLSICAGHLFIAVTYIMHSVMRSLWKKFPCICKS